jgi:hypothetical protein
MAKLDEFPLVPTDPETRNATSTDWCASTMSPTQRASKQALFSTSWLTPRLCVAAERISTAPLSAHRLVDGTPIVAHAP